MDFLYFLEGIRNPFLDSIVSALTHLGGETVFLIAALVVFWCVDKKQGYYLLGVGFMGTLVNQFLKITCRIPRPWVRDPNFTIVEAAREEATGYSFPSGHSTSSVGTFGVIAVCAKKSWLRLAAIALCVLIPFTRLYLGVHTPADVIVGSGISLVFIALLRPIALREDGKYLPHMFAVMTLFAAAFVAYMELYPFPADVDPDNLHAALKNSYTLLGALLGMLTAYAVDRRRDFPVAGVWYAQVIKVVVGLVLALAVKEGLKAPLELVFGTHMVARAIRYYALVIVAGVLWPMTFPRLSKLGRKDEGK